MEQPPIEILETPVVPEDVVNIDLTTGQETKPTPEESDRITPIVTEIAETPQTENLDQPAQTTLSGHELLEIQNNIKPDKEDQLETLAKGLWN